MSLKYKSTFEERANKIHNGFYSYHIPNIDIDSKSKIQICCPIHGIFIQTANNHLNGKGCKLCGNIKRTDKLRGGDIDQFITKANQIHGSLYDYSSVEYINPKTNVDIICGKHGRFNQRPDSHLSGSGCKLCANEKLSKFNIKPSGEFIEQSKDIHKLKYSYDDTEYVDTTTPVKITCDIHGTFLQKPQNHLRGKGCRKCASMGSKLEDFVENFLIANNVKYIKNDRIIISPKELDFIIPDKKIAIECHGLYWHSTSKKPDKKFHLNKLKNCIDKNYRLIQLFEDEIINSPKIVISRLKNLLGLITRSIPARKCWVVELSYNTCSNFLKKYHIQASDKSSIQLGLLYKSRLVSVMTFSKTRRSLGNTSRANWELVRFCNISNFKIMGGAGKLFTHFKRKYLNSGESVISYADRRWSIGNVYEKIGFSMTHFTEPNYWYFKSNDVKRLHRFSFRKSKLLKLGDFSHLTEFQIMEHLNYHRIYDCGSICFLYKKL